MKIQVYFGARIFNGAVILPDRALIVEAGCVRGIVAVADRPRNGEQVDLGGGVLSPGFVDWQVNGGGGALFNADPTPDGIRKIASAHRAHGTTSILPTLVTDAPSVLREGLKAAKEARTAVPGALGIHVEGPFIDVGRKGVHRADFIRAMQDADVSELIAARSGAMVATLAPNVVEADKIAALSKAGVIVSLGHSDATAEEAARAFAAGARAVTHLFNAMSQMQSRAPGLVGAALADPRVICGLIVDGRHVHDASLKTAVAAKGSRNVALVSDAMPPAAGGGDDFELQGRAMRRDGDRLVDENGVLAGALIVMRDAVAYCVDKLGIAEADALRMATSTPARLLGLENEIGSLQIGARADLVHLSDRLQLLNVFSNSD